MLLALLSVAFAHPGSALGGGTAGAPVIGQRIELGVARERVSLAYVAELPLRRVSDEAQSWAGEGTFAAAKIEELRGGLTLHVDGVPARLEWQPVVDAARTGDPGFVQLHLLGTIEPGVSRARISIRNANFPDEPGFHATYVRVAGTLVVTGSSLFRVRDGRLRDSTHGAWVRDESAREPWVELRPALPWERGEDAAAPERAAGLGGRGGGAVAAGVGGVVLLVASATGLAWRRWRQVIRMSTDSRRE